MIAAGSTKKKLYLNLSLCLQPCDWVDIIVVSEIKLKLSPKNAPPTIAAAISGKYVPVLSANDAAIGINATMVPTLVPMQSDTTQAEINNPATKKFAGKSCNVRFTVASTAPIALADDAKAPAKTNIHTMSSKSF